MTPSLPQTLISAPPAPPAPPMPFARVDGPKQGASPPPTVILPSRAGGVDELVGGGLTILGIGVLKFFVLAFLGLGGACFLGVLGMAFH